MYCNDILGCIENSMMYTTYYDLLRLQLPLAIISKCALNFK